MKIKLFDENKRLLKEVKGANTISLIWTKKLPLGGSVLFDLEKEKSFAQIKVLDVKESIVYLKNGKMEYKLPEKETDIRAFPKDLYNKDLNYFSLRTVEDKIAKGYRNIALNPVAQKDDNGSYPYAYANIETRGESTFFACNAIDGYIATDGHGPFPYQSWGINRDPNAKMCIDFGREVEIDKVVFFLRADYPHDSFWEKVTLEFDNEELTFNTTNSSEAQVFNIKKIKTTKVILKNLIKHKDKSPFPALIELELYGKYI